MGKYAPFRADDRRIKLLLFLLRGDELTSNKLANFYRVNGNQCSRYIKDARTRYGDALHVHYIPNEGYAIRLRGSTVGERLSNIVKAVKPYR